MHEQFEAPYLNQKQLAQRWTLSSRTLERWRSVGWGPSYLKLNGRVIYHIEDILEFEQQHRHSLN